MTKTTTFCRYCSALVWGQVPLCGDCKQQAPVVVSLDRFRPPDQDNQVTIRQGAKVGPPNPTKKRKEGKKRSDDKPRRFSCRACGKALLKNYKTCGPCGRKKVQKANNSSKSKKKANKRTRSKKGGTQQQGSIPSWKFDYSSERWLRRRMRYYQTHPRRCSACGLTAATAVIHLHHKTYERKYRELDEDLCPLCERCHSKVHDIHNKQRGKSLESVTDEYVASFKSDK